MLVAKHRSVSITTQSIVDARRTRYKCCWSLSELCC